MNSCDNDMTIMSDNNKSQTRKNHLDSSLLTRTGLSAIPRYLLSYLQTSLQAQGSLRPRLLSIDHFVLTLGCEVQLCKLSSQECQERYFHHPCLFIFKIGAVELVKYYVKYYLSMNFQYNVIY